MRIDDPEILETTEGSEAAPYLPDLCNAVTAGRNVQSTRSLWDLLYGRIEASGLRSVAEATREPHRVL